MFPIAHCIWRLNTFKLLRLFQFLATSFYSVFSYDYFKWRVNKYQNQTGLFAVKLTKLEIGQTWFAVQFLYGKKHIRCQRISVNFEIWKHHSKLRYQIRCFPFNYTPVWKENVLPLIFSLQFILFSDFKFDRSNSTSYVFLYKHCIHTLFALFPDWRIFLWKGLKAGHLAIHF